VDPPLLLSSISTVGPIISQSADYKTVLNKSVVVMHSQGSSKDAQNHEIYNLKLRYLLLPKKYLLIRLTINQINR